jgi:hypothetical protein
MNGAISRPSSWSSSSSGTCALTARQHTDQRLEGGAVQVRYNPCNIVHLWGHRGSILTMPMWCRAVSRLRNLHHSLLMMATSAYSGWLTALQNGHWAVMGKRYR